MTTHYLPTRLDAWDGWNINTAYMQFLSQQLQDALAFPATQQVSDFARRLQQAQTSVLTGQQTPQQIAADFR
jgi:hypothetical protein